jgi:galactose mutarotase-like enzyme
MYDFPSHATCIEPQSGPPNGINDDPFVLQANSVFTKKFTIEVQKIT